ncbi:hypothetical protein AB0C84_43495 [Actinomadura sp. NPDC048955]|uniref:hypothetical protein n=1 Tax=Actinomadura sp. NPDC048955 TaxID=3158228 RepID=UPI00340D73C7
MARFTVPSLNALAELAATQITDEQTTAFAQAAARIGDRYTLRNRFLMWLQDPDLTQVAGYEEWRKRGRKVKDDGSAVGKGLAFIAAITRPPKPGENANGRRPAKGMRVSYVFDIAHTEPLDDVTDAPSTAPAGIQPTEADIRAMLAKLTGELGSTSGATPAGFPATAGADETRHAAA